MSQCALGPDGDLRDASEITWYHDIDDAHPISGPTTAQSVGHCPQRTAHLTERLRDPNNTEAPGLVSQRKAVERYRAVQATIQASTSTSGTPSTRTIQSSYDNSTGSSSGHLVAVAKKRCISSVSVHSEDDSDSAFEQPTTKKGEHTVHVIAPCLRCSYI